MNIKISDLYDKCESIASTLGLSVNDRFVFDLNDETSVESIQKTFGGIEKILLPGNGRYLVLLVSNEKPDVLLAVFPETEEGNLKIEFYDVAKKESLEVSDGVGSEEEPLTLDNFDELLTTDEIEEKVNKFLFSDDEEEGEDEGKPADDDEDDEDDDDDVVEVVDDEDEEDDDEETEDDEEVKDEKPVSETKKAPRARQSVKEAEEPLAPPPAAAPAEAPVAEPAPDAPVADNTVTDPEKDIRSLIKFYTDELARKTADETVSTEVVSGIQAIIAGLVKNLEAMTDLQDTETKEAKATAKAVKDLETKSDNADVEVSEDGVPEGGEVPVDKEVVLDNPHLTSTDDAIPLPNDFRAGVADVTLDPETEPTVDDTIEIVDDGVPVVTDAPIDPATGNPVATPASSDLDKTVDAELNAGVARVGSDGLPASADIPTDAEIDSEIASLAKPASPELPPDVDVDHIVVEPDAKGPAVDDTVDVGTAEPEVTDAPVVTPDDDSKIEDELRGDIARIGDDGLPVDSGSTSDAYVDDQLSTLKKDGPEGQGMGVDVVAFNPDANAIKWSDSLYADGQPNMTDNTGTVPAALQEIKEYAKRLNKTVTECGDSVNEVTIGRINKFCNLCATAFDTWHKIQDSLSASTELLECLNRGNMTECEKMVQEYENDSEDLDECEETQELKQIKESAREFQEVQDYIKSIKKFL